jgi:hypothetical protein
MPNADSEKKGILSQSTGISIGLALAFVSTIAANVVSTFVFAENRYLNKDVAAVQYDSLRSQIVELRGEMKDIRDKLDRRGDTR